MGRAMKRMRLISSVRGWNKKVSITLLGLLVLSLACGCGARGIVSSPEASPPVTEAAFVEEVPPTEESSMRMTINDTMVTVQWEDNESVNALHALIKEAPLTIQMSMYGGFEQVGPIGTSLPRNDVQTTTAAGDIVLYSGNQIVVFYGSNSWAYTRLGKIVDKTSAEMEELLGNGNVTITLSMG